MNSAIVIGAGPAGSVAALLLARAGWGVSLIEQHRFPRDKVCGECLSALGVEVLSRHGLFESLLARGAIRLTRTLLHAPSGTTVAADLPRPMWGVSRVALDGLLIDQARHAGAAVIQPARVESVEPGPRPAVRARDLMTNVTERLGADVLLIADGKSALLNGSPPPPTGDLGIKTHFENVDGPRDAVELFGLSDCYGGLAPIEGSRWNAALSVPAARVRHHLGDLARLFAELVQENPTLRRRLAGARQCGPWLASPLPRFSVRPRWPQAVVPVGNAAAAVEPIGGEGMGLAIRSAELAAANLCTSRRPGILRVQYRQLWHVRAGACRWAGRLASNPQWSPRAATLLAAAPSLLRAGTALMGK